jgi:hypothetical protein
VLACVALLCTALLCLESCSGGAPAPSAESPTGQPSVVAWWRPAVRTAWQWQLSGPLDLSVDVPVYDVDGEETAAAQVSELHRLGRRAICYVSVGSWEPGRPDAAQFPRAVLGRPLDGFPDERWLDVRRLDVLQPLLQTRMQMCRDKGFDAIEPDNVDGYANDTGFPLTAEDQLRFDRMIAGLAHGLGLGVGLKNDGDQLAVLVGDFDFAVVEQCAQYSECERYRPFVDAGKAVLAVEYELPVTAFCPTMQRLGFSGMRKRLELNAYREPCPEPTSFPHS